MNSSSENNIDISIDELYEYSKTLNTDNEISDTNFELPDCDDEFVDEILNGKITENEVLLAAKYMKNGKAPGYDMVVNEYIKSTMHLFLPLYVELFNKILDNGVIPRVLDFGYHSSYI
jgi:hypothetical protein